MEPPFLSTHEYATNYGIGPLQPWFDKSWRPGEMEPL